MSDDEYGDATESTGYDASGGYTEYGADTPSDSGQVFYAACEDAHGISGQWLGPNRTSSADAHADADQHMTQWAGHSAYVVPY
jgi:hypothetical protein